MNAADRKILAKVLALWEATSIVANDLEAAVLVHPDERQRYQLALMSAHLRSHSTRLQARAGALRASAYPVLPEAPDGVELGQTLERVALAIQALQRATRALVEAARLANDLSTAWTAELNQQELVEQGVALELLRAG